MSHDSLEDALRAAGNPVDLFRGIGGHVNFPYVASEYTNWIDEQRACFESCVLADLSHHQMDQYIEGTDAIDALSYLSVNTFENFEVGQAKQPVMCNADGKMIGDGILQRISEDEFVLSGSPSPANWLQYHLETGDYDATAEIYPMSAVTDDDPRWFTYQIQGPNALDVMEAVTDDPLPDIPFFNFDWLSIDGTEVRALRHGMANQAGFELQGPFEEAESVKQAILDAGGDHGMRRLGTRSYKSLPVLIGWVDVYLKALYDEDDEQLRAYREWLSPESFEGSVSLVGSFESNDITDYYLSPLEAGYEHIIDFDHEFIGKEALQAEMADPPRELVTLVWDQEDAGEIYTSMFRDGTPYKFVDLPRARMRAHYDEVRAGDDLVGLSRHPGYSYQDRVMLSLCSIDQEYSDPGTEVTVVWGESGASPNPTIEEHQQTEISATVAPAPFVDDERKADW